MLSHRSVFYHRHPYPDRTSYRGVEYVASHSRSPLSYCRCYRHGSAVTKFLGPFSCLTLLLHPRDLLRHLPPPRPSRSLYRH